MTQQIIELGQMPDGAGGDTNRSANVKCNENFTELYDKMAEKGDNRDITSLSGLTTPLSVSQGGTGAKDASAARQQLGAAQRGKNEDITELAGLTKALSVEQGGTGASNALQACRKLGAAVLREENESYGTKLINSMIPAIAQTTEEHHRNTALSIYNGVNNDASCVISFLREGLFGCHFGIDTDNQLKVGGWSMGQRAHRIFHEGNLARAADGTLKAI